MRGDIVETNLDLTTLENAQSHWDLIEVIGEGTYGEVYRALNKLSNNEPRQAAIKVIQHAPNKYDELQVELSIFRRFSRHPNMVDFYGAYLNKNTKGGTAEIWMVMEYCEGRSVSELAKGIVHNNHTLSENPIRYILHQTLMGIAYLHKHRVIHRDIKGPNILMTINGSVKLIDYGVSAQLAYTMQRRHSSVGSPFWMAPEVIACEQQLDYSYDNRCDIWSLGITAIELADGDPPLSDEHPMKVLFKIPRSPPPTVKRPQKWSAKFLNFIARCLTKDYEHRPAAEQILLDAFVKDVEENLAHLRRELMSALHIVMKQYKSYTRIGEKQRNGQDELQNAKRNIRMLQVDDLATLSKLTEEIVLEHLHERYTADQIYTYIGEILVAVNPFKPLQIYGEGASMLYQNSQKGDLPPHIFMFACSTYQAMIHKQRDQCCIINGESGSGKTVSAGYLVQQLARIGRIGGTRVINEALVKKILQVNPLLEAFGNAQTVINPNSSRFGKFLELHFTSSGSLVGAQLTEYMLEKSRVVSQPRGERNFHMLYYLIAGLDFHKKLDEFELSAFNRHKYLNTDDLSLSETACTSDMQLKFAQVQACFEILGFTKEEIQSLYCLLAGVIHIGDIEFVRDDTSYDGEKSKVTVQDTLETVASLLMISPKDLEYALITNSSVTRGETITRNNTVEQALDCRDATAKALYGRLFTWIVKRINALLRAEDKTSTLNTKVCILDIFGFENVSQNSFEQLCINIANEQLQFYFNEHIFSWEYEEYAAEGIQGVYVEYKNNKAILDLFLQKPVGVLALLDEESRFPKASDLTLVEKLEDNITSSHFMSSPDRSTLFAVEHFAEKVTYDATGFLEKNRDTLSSDVIQLLRLSDDRIVSVLFQSTIDPQGRVIFVLDSMPFAGEASEGERASANTSRSDKSFFDNRGGGGGQKAMSDSRYSTLSSNRFQLTVSTGFRHSLRTLLSKVVKSDPYFIRCIRPNKQNVPENFDKDTVLKQLRYTGVLETIKIRRQGYPERTPFEEFNDRYRFLKLRSDPNMHASKRSEELLHVAELGDEPDWKIGKSKVFLRYWHVDKLNKLFEEYRQKVLVAQRCVRLWFFRRRMRQARALRHAAAAKIQATWRMYRQRKEYLMLQEELRRRQAELPGGKVSAAAVRPFYRNIMRELRGHNDQKEFYEDDVYDMDVDKGESWLENSKIHVPDKLNPIDESGQAALEETRAIIFLSQAELACKEAFDRVCGTAYPVIHSNRLLAGHGEALRMKNQKLDHKERVLNVVEGLGDPLHQKYRLARLHIAGNEDDLAAEQDRKHFENPPMLGLIEKPDPLDELEDALEEQDNDGDHRMVPDKPKDKGMGEELRSRNMEQRRGQDERKKKEAQDEKKRREEAEKNKKLRDEEERKRRVDDPYPSRAAKPQKNGSEWFYMSTPAKVLEEKQLIEQRIREKRMREDAMEERLKTPVRRQQTATPSYRPYYPLDSMRRPSKVQDHRPYNYLLNDRIEPADVLRHHGVNDSPVFDRRLLPSTPSSYRPNHFVPPNKSPRRFSELTASPLVERRPIRDPARQHSPPPRDHRKPAADYSKPLPDYNRSSRVPPSPMRQPQRPTHAVPSTPVRQVPATPARQNAPESNRPNVDYSRPPTRPDSNNNDLRNGAYPTRKAADEGWVDPRDLGPKPLPGLARSAEFNPKIKPRFMESKSPEFEYKPERLMPAKPKKPKGFNYGLQEEQVLQDHKLRRTGKLQELLSVQ